MSARLDAGGPRREDLVARVSSALRGEINARGLPPGTRLPSETEIAKGLGVSRPTLREAFRVLAQEGMLKIRHGVGTFVAAGPRHLSSPLDSMLSLSALIRAAGGEPKDRGLVIDEIASSRDVAAALSIAPKSGVIRIKRVRLIDDRPLGLAHEYVPVGPTVSFEAFKRFKGGSLYGFLTQTLGLALLRSDMAVTAVNATAQQSRLLALKPGAPLLLMREIHFGENDRRVLYSVNHHNSDVIDLTVVRSGVRM
ncbi:GntR family transcriptional regulator [Hyphomicrobiales bacterium BP6-180914]|uniref:GntR family transcriptional regulator n=1 Tax=Lichenifustis flavocetrariae TaxID=2949735 RepID=A0AA42CPP5_9HYPH|nr:GntR family transcriptional regulator [Lichenifustis flavocetrariae]